MTDPAARTLCTARKASFRSATVARFIGGAVCAFAVAAESTSWAAAQAVPAVHPRASHPAFTVREVDLPPCGVVAAAILPVGAIAAPTGYAAYLLTKPDSAAPVSGSLRISASGNDYRIAFSDKATMHAPFRNDQRDPIRFDLPSGAQLDSAFVERITTPDGTPRRCPIEDPWTPATNSAVSDSVAGLLADVVPGGPALPLAAIPAGETCDAGDIQPAVRFSARPEPGTWWNRTIVVTMNIDIDAGSRVTGVHVTQSNAGADKRYEEAIVAAAKTSVFVTGFHDCRPLPATITYTQKLLGR